MKKKRRRPLRIGDVVTCKNELDMMRKIKYFAGRGVDVKPIYGEMAIEVIDIDRK